MPKITRDTLTPSLHSRLWAKIDTTTGPRSCWIWQGSCLPEKPGFKGPSGGYGRIQVKDADGKWYVEYAHRLIYVACVGDVPDDLHVLHECDTPKCCNPLHLFLGTPQDNADDREAKGRRPNRGWSVVRPELEPEICKRFQAGESLMALAAEYELPRRGIIYVLDKNSAWRISRPRKAA